VLTQLVVDTKKFHINVPYRIARKKSTGSVKTTKSAIEIRLLKPWLDLTARLPFALLVMVISVSAPAFSHDDTGGDASGGRIPTHIILSGFSATQYYHGSRLHRTGWAYGHWYQAAPSFTLKVFIISAVAAIVPATSGLADAKNVAMMTRYCTWAGLGRMVRADP